MPKSLEFLIKILQLELKEVEHDLNSLKILHSNRHDNSEITHYVFLENTALLQSELISIRKVGTIIDNYEVDDTMTGKELLESIDDYLKKEIAERQFSEAIYNFVKAKIAKVSKYLDM